jgi:hypothetical protein
VYQYQNATAAIMMTRHPSLRKQPFIRVVGEGC